MLWRSIGKNPVFWLGVMVLGALVISSYSSVVSYDNFRSVSATNTGTIAQAVASATFGYHVPLYEAADCAARDACSFLLMHSSLVLYLATPFYAIAPSTVTLLVLQSLIITAGAVPLYWLTRQVTHSAGKSLFAAGLYLVWAPVFSNYTLHAESILPVEILTLAALWQAGRYRWGLGVAIVTFLTFNVAPIFVFLVGLFFLVPYVWRWTVRRWRHFQWREPERPGNSEKPARWSQWFRSAWSIREIRYTVALLAASVVAYALILSFIDFWGAWALGIAEPISTSGPGISASLGTIVRSSATVWTGEYWLILLALVAFLPLLSPRSLILFGPWILYTFLVNSAHFTTIGQPYTVVNTGPIFVGVAYGLARVPWPARSAPSETPASSPEPSRAERRRSLASPRGKRFAKAGVVTVLGVVVVVNLLLIPINPALPDLGFRPGAPFISPGSDSYFNNSLKITPGLEWAENLASVVPLHATIAASAALYALVARWPNVIDMNQGIQPYGNPTAMSRLPFNVSSGPQYVFIDYPFLNELLPKFQAVLSNSSEYGLRGYVSSTAIGPLFLYEQNYSPPAQRFGPPLAGWNRTLAPKAGLSPGPEGQELTNATSPTGKEIRSLPKATVTGPVWTGPNVLLAPGTYTMRFVVSASGSALTTNPNLPVLRLVGAGFGATSLNQTVPASAFVSGKWTTVTVSVMVVNPVPLFNFEGFALEPKVSVALASVTISPTS